MNILITSSRAPVTLDLIRSFGRAGHTVYATDTQPWTLGSHSRYLAQHMITPAPRFDPAGFVAALERDDLSQLDRVPLLSAAEEVELAERMERGAAAERRRASSEDLSRQLRAALRADIVSG